jgi:5-methylcytosine-specific restriction endonuclease McrA
MVSEARKMQIREAMRRYRARHPELAAAYKKTPAAMAVARVSANRRYAAKTKGRIASLPAWVDEAVCVLKSLRKKIVIKTAFRRWQKKNAVAMKVHQHRRRARLFGAHNDGSFTKNNWTVRLDGFVNACAYCLSTTKKLSADHVVAISKGGEHSIENIVPACKPCNSRKKDKGILTMVNVTVSPS